MGIRPKSFHPFIVSRDNVDIFVELSVERPSNVDRGEKPVNPLQRRLVALGLSGSGI